MSVALQILGTIAGFWCGWSLASTSWGRRVADAMFGEEEEEAK